MVSENCGVVGVFSLSNHNVLPIVIDSLRALEHRGQESWGIAVPKKNPLKKLGLVSEAASEFQTIIKKYRSYAAIGHVPIFYIWQEHTRKRAASQGKGPMCRSQRYHR